MKFDDLGLPQVNGSTDLQDSAALAGIMTVFEWPQKIDLKKYVIQLVPDGVPVPIGTIFFKYVRHPLEISYDFSRDQAVCLIAGLFVQNQKGYVDADFINGSDFLSPAIKGHIQRCKGLRANWFQDLWLWADLWFSAKFKPLDELNQLFCMMMIADPKFIKWYCENNPKWQQSIKNYWCENAGSWRNEHELAALMIEKINEVINGV